MKNPTKQNIKKMNRCFLREIILKSLHRKHNPQIQPETRLPVVDYAQYYIVHNYLT